MKRRIDDLYNDQGGKGGGPGSKSKRQTPVQPSGRKNEDNMLAPSRPLGIGEQIATRFPSPNLYPGNVVQSETAAGQRAGSGLSSGEQPWAACRATQVLQRVPGLPLGQQQQQQQQQYQTAGRGYLSNGYSAGLPSALSQVAPQNFYDLSSLRLQQQANNLQQQYQASLFEAHLRAQPQSQHLRYPFPSSEATAVLNAYPLNNLANYARAGVNEVSSSGLTRGMQASGIHQNTNYFRLQGSGQNLAPGASRNLQNVQNLPSNISFLPNNNTAQSSWTSTSRVGNIPQTQPTDSSCKLVYVPEDDHQLNPFQRFARQQMEFFEAGEDDLNTGCQGRNKPIQKGQVGIRCIHCAILLPKAKARSACYYPSRLDVVYQAAQNIINVHLPTLCESIPESVRTELVQLDHKRSKVGGGKDYWKEKALELGVIDTKEDGLRFRDAR